MPMRAKRRKALLIFSALLFAAVAFAYWVWLAAFPALFEKACQSARSRAASALNQAAEETLLAFDLTTLERTETAGGAVIIKSGAAGCGALAAKASARAQELFADQPESAARLYAFELLPAWLAAKAGPALWLSYERFGAATAECVWDFATAGVNQSVHTLTLKMRMDVTVQSRGKSREYSVEAAFPAAQTIVIGEVPQSFAGGAISLIP